MVFYNVITGEYILSIEGFLSINDSVRKVSVTCKTESGYKKHVIGLSDNVTYFCDHSRY